MCVPNCKSVTRTISRMRQQPREYPPKQERAKKKARMEMAVPRIRLYSMTLTALPPIMSIMGAVVRTNKRRRMT
jgi:hypothetical protein